MKPQADFMDALEVQKVRSWLISQHENVQLEAVQEVACIRIDDLLRPLRYAHSESRLKSVLQNLRDPSLTAAFQVLNLDLEEFISGAEFHVRNLGTTRPDDFWRKCGVGRPSKKFEVAT